MNFSTLCWIGLFICLGTICLAQDSEAPGSELSPSELETLLAELEQNLGDLSTLRTQFVQEKHLAIFEDVVRAEGVFYFAKPDNIRFEITKPFRSVLITHGRSVARFEYWDGEWIKLQRGGDEAILAVTSQIATWMQGRFRDQAGTYRISARKADATEIILLPEDEDLAKYISRIELTLDEAHTQITQLEIHEPSGDFTVVVFTAHQHDVALADSTFRTTGAVPFDLADDVKAP